ncbi:hypothetical protein FV113G1_P10660 (plasmid) [Fusobacterium varium]|nr:hypothetical protein FV113G1_P10660 [Fusobacterium varium]
MKIKKYYRLYGCRFTEEEYKFIKNKIKEINKYKEKKISNTEILLKLFTLMLKKETL